MEKTDAIRKVRALEAQAAQTQYDQEAETYRAKAAALRQQYAITDDDLEPETEGLFAGFLSHLSDPEWQQLQEDRRRLFDAITDTIDAAVRRGQQVENLAWRLDYLEDLYEHVRTLKDDHRYKKNEQTGELDTIAGVRLARDQAMADLFIRHAVQINSERHEEHHAYRRDRGWIEYVKTQAERRVLFAAKAGARLNSVQAALRRVNGYNYFYTVLFPPQGCIDLSRPTWQQKRDWQP